MRKLLLLLIVLIIPFSANGAWEKCNTPKTGAFNDIVQLGDIFLGATYYGTTISKDKCNSWEIQDNLLKGIEVYRIIDIDNVLYYLVHDGIYFSLDTGKVVNYLRENDIWYGNFAFSNSSDRVYYVRDRKLKYYFDGFKNFNEIFRNEDSIECNYVSNYKSDLIAFTNKGFYLVDKVDDIYKKIEGTEEYLHIRLFTYTEELVFFINYKTLYIADRYFKTIKKIKDIENVSAMYFNNNYLYFAKGFNGIYKYNIEENLFDSIVHYDNQNYTTIKQIKNDIYFLGDYSDAVKLNTLTNQFDIIAGFRDPSIIKVKTQKNRYYGIVGSYLMYSDDEGLNWDYYDKVNKDLNSIEIIDSIFFMSKFTLNTKDKFGENFRSTNYGKDWNRMNNVEYGMPQYINDFLFDKGNLYMACSSGALVSNDSGLTWKTLDRTLYEAKNILVIDSFLFVSGAYGLSKINLKTNLNVRMLDVSNYMEFYAIQIADTVIIYEEFWSYLYYYKSSDRGKTFNVIRDGLKTPSYKLYSNKHQLSIIDSVLCFSFDQGATWVNLLELSEKEDFGSYIITDDYIYGNHPDGILRKKLSEFSTTDVIDREFNNDNIIYPNPATDYITINLERCATLQKCGTSVVEIYDVMGFLIQTTPSASQPPLHEGNLKIDVSNLPPGVYFVKINNKYYKFVRAI